MTQHNTTLTSIQKNVVHNCAFASTYAAIRNASNWVGFTGFTVVKNQWGKTIMTQHNTTPNRTDRVVVSDTKVTPAVTIVRNADGLIDIDSYKDNNDRISPNVREYILCINGLMMRKDDIIKRNLNVDTNIIDDNIEVFMNALIKLICPSNQIKGGN